MTYVYWIHYSDHDITKDGYVGVTNDPKQRFLAHKRKNKKISEDAIFDIIFEGTREESFELEYLLRPQKNIGWNNAIGGQHGWRYGFSHTTESKDKMKSAWTDDRKSNASKMRKIINKGMKGQKREKQSENMRGEKNPMFGTTRPQHVKDAVSNAHKNKTPHNKIECYCMYCRKKSNPYSLKKYHGIGKTNCISKEEYDQLYKVA